MPIKSIDEPWALITDLTEKAYTNWWTNRDWTVDDFRNSLNYLERIAVHVTNLSHQVEDGGFEQWYDNGYYTTSTWKFLIGLCETLITGNFVSVDVWAVTAVKNLLIEFGERIDEHEFQIRQGKPKEIWYPEEEKLRIRRNVLTNDFFEVRIRFLNSVEVYLRTLLKPMTSRDKEVMI